MLLRPWQNELISEKIQAEKKHKYANKSEINWAILLFLLSKISVQHIYKRSYQIFKKQILSIFYRLFQKL